MNLSRFLSVYSAFFGKEAFIFWAACWDHKSSLAYLTDNGNFTILLVREAKPVANSNNSATVYRVTKEFAVGRWSYQRRLLHHDEQLKRWKEDFANIRFSLEFTYTDHNNNLRIIMEQLTYFTVSPHRFRQHVKGVLLESFSKEGNSRETSSY